MLIYKNDKYYIYIHIPKNGGKFIRDKICSNKKNEIIQQYWEIKDNIDLAHIPYVKRYDYVDPNIKYQYYTYSRNPYDRLISAFFYLFATIANSQSFRYFIKHTLNRFQFSIDFNLKLLHFYPQYLFICDENLNIPNDIIIYKLEDTENPPVYDLYKYYDSETFDIVNKIYDKDFKILNYPKINYKKINLNFF